MRILTIGAKSTINTALAKQPGMEVWSMSIGGDVPTGVARVLPYNRSGKVALSGIQQVRRAIRESQPDLVHAFYPRPLAHAVLATSTLGSRVPIVSYRGIATPPQRWNPEQWITYHSPLVTAHACESEAVTDSLVASGIPADRCHVVYNTVGPPQVALPSDEVRRELGLAPDAFVVMMVANLRRVKGADLLIEAAKRCLDLPQLQIVLVGRVLDSRLKRLAAQPQLQGRVFLRGYEPKASKLLAAADLFAMPSRAEALCMALVEAMTAGICPVVSNAGGMKEAVRHQTDGIVFPSEDAQALATAIRTLYHDRDLMQQYAGSAQARVLREFSSDAMAQRLAKLYANVLRVPSGVAA
ncbi:glycosyltransferase family 4 protein [Aeoliella sp. SH292]|uniref:glycosyltransferase family 4 protein n=1 Tax=Aeoliella sp. SH292 TaxID=3454464 RepID=UPI003F98C01B